MNLKFISVVKKSSSHVQGEKKSAISHNENIKYKYVDCFFPSYLLYEIGVFFRYINFISERLLIQTYVHIHIV